MKKELIKRHYEISKFTVKLLELINIEPNLRMDMDEIIKRLNGKVTYKSNAINNNYEIYKIDDKEYEFEIVIEDRYLRAEFRECISLAISELIFYHGYMANPENWSKKKVGKNLVKPWKYDVETVRDISFMSHSLLLDWNLFREEMKDSYKGDGYYDLDEVAKKFDVPERMIINKGKLTQMLAW